MAQTQQLTVSEKAAAFIDSILDQIEESLPATVTVQRFRAAAVNLAVHSPNVYSCTPSSLRSSLLKCAVDGLVPDGRLAAIVPYRTKGDDGKYYMMAQYIPMYQGLISRARELGETFSVTANVVHQNDVFSVDESSPETTTHKRPPLNQDRGGIVGAYVIFRAQDGRVIHREIMDARELAKVQNVSRAKEGPWKQWPDQMFRKTVIRRGAKYIPMSTALRTIIDRDDELNEPNGNGADTEALADYNPLTGKTIEHQPKPQPASPDAPAQPAQDPQAGEEPPAAELQTPSGNGGGGAPEPAAQGDLLSQEEAPAKSAKSAGNEPKGNGKSARKENPAAILSNYSNELMQARVGADLQKRSAGFWSDLNRDFPDEGTKMHQHATAIFAAHLARVTGQGSPAEVDAVMKSIQAETAW